MSEILNEKSEASKKERDTNLHKGHRDRLRKRYLTDGLDGFDEHNALELLLFYALPRRDTNEIAHRLIKKFGSFAEVLDAPVHELEQVKDVGHAAAVFLSMLPDFQRYYINSKNNAKTAQGLDEIEEYAFNRLYGLTEENVLLICVDNKMKMISADIVCKGSVNNSGVNTRLIIDLALRHNAVAVVIAHNHPRGFALPSREDIYTTKHLNDALKAINVRLLDHIICNPTEHASLVQSGQFDNLFD